MIIVTGGSGFIGSNFILDWLDRFDEQIINIDIMTYAANKNNLKNIKKKKNIIILFKKIYIITKKYLKS